MPTLMFYALLNAAHRDTAFAWGTTHALLVDRMARLALFDAGDASILQHMITFEAY